MGRLSFRCDAELVEHVDEARGDVPRERWLRGVVEGELARARGRREQMAHYERMVAEGKLGFTAPFDFPAVPKGK